MGRDSLPGPWVIAMEDADVEQVLENDMQYENEVAYDFVGDVVLSTGFPCVNLLSMLVTSPIFWKFSLALAIS